MSTKKTILVVVIVFLIAAPVIRYIVPGSNNAKQQSYVSDSSLRESLFSLDPKVYTLPSADETLQFMEMLEDKITSGQNVEIAKLVDSRAIDYFNTGKPDFKKNEDYENLDKNVSDFILALKSCSFDKIMIQYKEGVLAVKTNVEVKDGKKIENDVIMMLYKNNKVGVGIALMNFNAWKQSSE